MRQLRRAVETYGHGIRSHRVVTVRQLSGCSKGFARVPGAGALSPIKRVLARQAVIGRRDWLECDGESRELPDRFHVFRFNHTTGINT